MAWRVLDAQWWGVPQRRRRIALVADFGGTTAHEILFNAKGVYGHPAASRAAGERLAGNAESGASYAVRIRGGCDGGGKGALVQEDKSGTLGTGNDQSIFCYGISAYESNAMKSRNPHSGIYEADTARTLDQNGGSPACNQGGMAVVCAGFRLGNGEQARSIGYADEQSPTLNAECGETNGTLQAKESGQSLNLNDTVRQNMIVRRLTPTECERLQGFPDGWTDIGEWTDEKGKLHKESLDSARYKALGNSIALPPWKWVLKRICAQYERDATMGSLFDGIGGFTLLWTQLNGWNSVKWASEIEPFCIAVTKRHFCDEKCEGEKNGS